MLKFRKMGIVMSPRQDSLGKFARFNPGVVVQNDIVHMLYRATNSDIADKQNYISSLGYAKLDIQGNVLYDSNEKVIFPTIPEERMGCEDPRIIAFEGKYYIFYTAYDGEFARVAIAQTDDFVNYNKLGVIKHFAWDKDAFIFPERINGKIAYIHRVMPDIQLDFFDGFEDMLNEDNWNGYENRIAYSVIMKPKYDWESQKVGGSAPPLKTEKGWILIYHGVDDNNVYRSSVALLDLNNPRKVISRIPYPMLEPEEEYELYGDVNNVVFPQGAYINNGEIFVYYGAADKHIAIAKIQVRELLDELNNYKTF